LVSVVFDVRDSVQYLMGDQGPMVIDEGAPAPYFSLAMMAVGAVSLLIYAFKKDAPKPEAAQKS